MLKDEKVREALDLEALRRREVQMMGAALSTRSWHGMENAYNQLRDKIDAELSRLARAALSPPAQAEASTLPGEVVAWMYRYRVQYVPKLECTKPLPDKIAFSVDRWNDAEARHWAETPLYAAAPPTTPAVESGEALELALAFVRKHCVFYPGSTDVHFPRVPTYSAWQDFAAKLGGIAFEQASRPAVESESADRGAEPCQSEIEVLRILNGENVPGWGWGAAMSECCSALVGYGFAKPAYEITQAGKDFLAAIDGETT